MPSCEEFAVQISCLIDGELAEDETQALFAHMDSCETCKTVYDSFRFIASALSDELSEAPENLAASVMEKIRETPRIEKKRGPGGKILFLRYGAVAACLALALLGASRLNWFRMGNAAPRAAEGASASAQYRIMSEPMEAPAPTEAPVPAPAEPAAEGEDQAAQESVNTAGFAGETEDVRITGEKTGPLMMAPPPENAQDTIAETLTTSQADAFLAELAVKNMDGDANLPETEPEIILAGESTDGETFTVYVYNAQTKPLAIVSFNGERLLFTGDIGPYLTPES